MVVEADRPLGGDRVLSELCRQGHVLPIADVVVPADRDEAVPTDGPEVRPTIREVAWQHPVGWRPAQGRVATGPAILAVGDEDFAGESPDGFPPADWANEMLDELGGAGHVAVEKHKRLTARLSRRGVARPAGTAMGKSQHASAHLRRELRGAVPGAVVRDQDLPGRVRLGLERVEQANDVLLLVVGGNHDADARIRGPSHGATIQSPRVRERKTLRDRTGIMLAAQRAVLRTSGGPLRALWAAAYELLARAVSAYLRIGRRAAAVYLRGSLAKGEPIYGPADIDLAVVVPPEEAQPGRARRRAHERWRPLVERLPRIDSLVQLNVYEVDELHRASAVTALTEHQLPGAGRPFADEAGLRIRPGLGGTTDWRRIGGPELRPGPSPIPRHLVAWLELQWWWRLCLEACRQPERLHVPSLCLKLITQSARVRLWLEQGELLSGHEAVLERCLATMPDEEDALRGALSLRRALPRSPDPPLADATGFLLRTVARAAALLREEPVDAGIDVALSGAESPPDELALTAAMRSSLADLEGARLFPLADWRARTPAPLWLRGRVDPLLGDEGLALVDADPADPAQLNDLGTVSRSGLRPAVSMGPLLVLPSADYFGWVHRSIQFQYSDPVSFALQEGSAKATFPALSGWSASDCAHRAVDAHAQWLRLDPETDPARAGIALGLLLGAARAALFQQSLEESGPELALTLAATAGRLAAEQPGSAGLLEEAAGAYRAWREDGPAPDLEAVTALRGLIERLPAYDSLESVDGFAPLAAGATGR